MIALKLFILYALIILMTNGCATEPVIEPIPEPTINIEHRYA